MEQITIPMEEYKELLIIKGKYEELKVQSWQRELDKTTSPYNPTLIRKYGSGSPIPESPYKIFCENTKEN